MKQLGECGGCMSHRKVVLVKEGLHPRNRHRARYDFEMLSKSCPEILPYLLRNRYNDVSIDFADPVAVRMLNRAMLKHFYGITAWDLPAGYLCPPVPGRADYIHHIADLLASGNGGVIPRGRSVRVLDIGVGASCIYPVIGHREYGWSFIGSDVDPVALASARRIVESNRGLREAIKLRLQGSPPAVFKGLLKPGEVFDAVICNPPFHASPEEAIEGSLRKWKKLGKDRMSGEGVDGAPVLNFGGKGCELWCPGGELAFVLRMIEESAEIAGQCSWFSALVSNSSHLPALYRALKRARVQDVRTIDMAQGQKKSRLIAWIFTCGVDPLAISTRGAHGKKML